MEDVKSLTGKRRVNFQVRLTEAEADAIRRAAERYGYGAAADWARHVMRVAARRPGTGEADREANQG